MTSTAIPPTHRAGRALLSRCAGPAALGVGVFVFLFMYLSAAGVEQTARSCVIPTEDCAAVSVAAHRFGDDWKHGMTSDWPVFVPGFFLLAGTTALWARHRSWRSLVVTGPAIIAVAAAGAWLLAPRGTAPLLGQFLREFSSPGGAVAMRAPIMAIAGGLLTVVASTAFIVTFQRAVAYRAPWLVAVPAAIYAVLNGVRPGELRSLAEPWAARLVAGDLKAVATTLLVPCVVALLWWDARRTGPAASERNCPGCPPGAASLVR